MPDSLLSLLRPNRQAGRTHSPVIPPEMARSLRHEQVKLVYDYLPVSQLVSVINAAVVVGVQSLVMKSAVLLIWLYAVCMVALVRLLGGMAFRRISPSADQALAWRRHAIAGAAASGAVWGCAAVFLFPPANEAHQVFVAFVVGGMVAGSVTTLAPVFPAFAAFAGLSLVPTIIRFLLERQVIHYAMGWLTLVFFAAMVLIAWRAHRGMSEMLRLTLHNNALVGELLAAQEGQRRSHEELEVRVAERTRELSRTNAELERFASVASHDLQEPLRNAANFALLLGSRYRERLDDEGREFLQYIVGSVTHMRQLVDGLLFQSRLAKLPQLARIDCEALLLKVLSNFRAALGESGAVVTHDPLPEVQADAGQLEQVFSNLLSNALKFRGSEPPRIHVGARADDDKWIFSVKDNGIGVDPRYAEQIFEMFERLHSQAQFPGTGMGLAICRKIVEAHHGRIWIDSEAGRGATFFFTLPRARGEPGA